MRYICRFFIFHTRGESEVKGDIDKKKNKGKTKEEKEKEEEGEEVEEVARRRRVRADFHEVSSFYRHSWKIP